MATIRNVAVRLTAVDRGFARGFRRASRDVERFQRDANGRLHDLNGRFVAEGQAAGEGYGRSFRTSALKSLGKLSKLTKGFTVSVKAAAAVGALSALAGGAAVAAQAMIQLSAAIAPVSGLLVAVPGAVGIAAAAIGTLKLALVGVGDAFKSAMGADTEAFKESLKQLSPAARKVAIELHKLRPVLLGIQQTAQNAVFRPLRGELTATAKALNVPLRSAFKALGTEIGLAGRELARFARSAETIKGLQSIFFSASRALSFLRPALQPLLAGFRDLAVVGGRFLTSLTPAIGAAVAEFGRFLSAASRSGQATQWMSDALAVLQQLFRILGNIGSIFASVFRAANAAGGGLLGTFERLTGQFAKFLKSTEGVRTLRSIFTGIADIGRALGPVVIALARGLGQIAPAIGRIAQVVGPVLTRAVNALAPALAALEPGITALIVGLGGAIDAIAPALPAVAKALSAVAVALSPVLPALGQLVSLLAQGLASTIQTLVSSGALSRLVDAVIQVAFALGNGLLDALVAITPYLPDLTVSLADLLVALIPLIPPITQMVVALAPLVPVLTDVIKLATQLAGFVMPVLTAEFYAQAVGAGVLVDVIRRAWGYIYGFIRDRINNIKSAIDWFKTLPGKFGTWFKDARDGATKKLGELVDWVKGLPGRITRALGDLGGLLYDAGRSVINGLINGITSRFESLRKVLSSVTRAIPNWKGPYDTDKRLLTPAGQAIMGGLITGIVGQLPALRAALGTVTATIGAPAQPGLAVAGPGMPQPRGALQGSGTQVPAIDYQRLALALVSAMKQQGVGAAYIDGRLVTDVVSRREGQTASLRRRTG